MSTRKTRSPARRIAVAVAAAGMLATSSGAVLLATAPGANAADGGQLKYFVCKYVGKPGVDEVLQPSDQNPISVAASAIKEDPIVIGSSFADAQGRSVVLALDDTPPGPEGDPSADDCPPPTPPEPEPEVIAVDVVFVEPTCDNGNTASYTLTGDTDDVTVSQSAAPAPGAEITVTATAKDDFVFAGDESTYSETHMFDAAADCDVTPPVEEPPVVEPPVVEPPVVQPPVVEGPTVQTPVATPTVVHAGLAGTTTDVRSEQGVALLGGGLVLMAAAAGMARPRRARR